MTIAILHLLAVASPGPDFALIIRQSIRFGRKVAWMTTAGIALGIMVHISYSLIGFGVLMQKSVWFFTTMKTCGAIYLIYLGGRSFAATSAVQLKVGENPMNTDRKYTVPRPYLGGFISGLLTNVLNPKAGLFFIAVFSVVVHPTTPIPYKLGYGCWMVFMNLVWFGMISILFSQPILKNKFATLGQWMERIMGIILILLGLNLLFLKI